MKMHHVGYLVSNIDKSIIEFEKIEDNIAKEIYWDEDRKAKICFVACKNVNVELIEPNKESDLYPLLKKYKNVPYHICYEVDNLDEEVKCLRSKGFLVIKPIENARAISETAKVVFLMNANIGIIELLEQ